MARPRAEDVVASGSASLAWSSDTSAALAADKGGDGAGMGSGGAGGNVRTGGTDGAGTEDVAEHSESTDSAGDNPMSLGTVAGAVVALRMCGMRGGSVPSLLRGDRGASVGVAVADEAGGALAVDGSGLGFAPAAPPSAPASPSGPAPQPPDLSAPASSAPASEPVPAPAPVPPSALASAPTASNVLDTTEGALGDVGTPTRRGRNDKLRCALRRRVRARLGV